MDMLRNRHAPPPAEGGSILGYSRNNPFFMSGPLPQRGEPCLELLLNRAVHVASAAGGQRWAVLLPTGLRPAMSWSGHVWKAASRLCLHLTVLCGPSYNLPAAPCSVGGLMGCFVLAWAATNAVAMPAGRGMQGDEHQDSYSQEWLIAEQYAEADEATPSTEAGSVQGAVVTAQRASSAGAAARHSLELPAYSRNHSLPAPTGSATAQFWVTGCLPGTSKEAQGLHPEGFGSICGSASCCNSWVFRVQCWQSRALCMLQEQTFACPALGSFWFLRLLMLPCRSVPSIALGPCVACMTVLDRAPCLSRSSGAGAGSYKLVRSA